MRRLRTCVGVIAAVVAGLLSAKPILAAADTTASFSISAPTEIPGAVLKPGEYTIQLLDHLADRSIVRLDAVTGPTHVTFLCINAATGLAGTAHPVEWPQKAQGRHALRGFVFSGGTNVEFVYPKADAVALATANNAGVVAIDPASEGRPELSKLTNSDMQVVNLWMLTPVRVGPEGAAQKGIDARRYQPAPSQAAPTQSASLPPASHPPAPSQATILPRPQAIARAEAPVRPLAPVRHARPIVNRLPQTASAFPLFWIAGLLSLAGAGLLRFRRSLRA